MAKPQNIVGPQVRKLRYQQGITQEMLAARCGVLGWDLSRAILSKIEAQLRCVTDAELEILAGALRVQIAALFPAKTDRSARKLS
jgi:transcriptional regulator with XRE-family HTH domain